MRNTVSSSKAANGEGDAQVVAVNRVAIGPRTKSALRRLISAISITSGKNAGLRPRALSVAALSLSSLTFAATANPNSAVSAAPDHDWPSYNRTLAGDRFSPLADINRRNVAKLTQKCEYQLPAPTSFQTSPLAIDGILYFTSPDGSFSIDAATCKERWHVTHPVPKGEGVVSANRGFAYYDGTLFRGTLDGHVLAISPKDGHTIWDIEIPDAGPGVSIPMAPIAADGKVFVGNAGGDRANVTGHAYAFDAKTGKLLWRFEVVPDTPEVRATWKTPPGNPLSGGGLWTSLTYDEKSGVLYAPSGNPAPDFDIELRQGDNLYVNSLLAIDGASGRLITYNQIVKRDFHDYGMSGPPALVTTAAGRRIVASANKDGMLSVVDRGDLKAGLPLLYAQPTTTRKNVDVPLSRERPTAFCPGMWGGSEWNGAAFSPRHNTIFVGTVDWCSRMTLQPKNAPVPKSGDIWLGVKEPIPKAMLDWSTARGWLTAFDADTGAVRWKLQLPKPVLAGVTPTAGELVFAADLSGDLFAVEAASGKRLWSVNLEQPIGGGIITYRAGGQQLIAAAVGNGGGVWPIEVTRSSIVVYGLR